jgi:hypothetical protein
LQPERKDGEVVVNVVEHAKRRVDLRVQLTNHSREEDHGETACQEHLGKDRRAPKFSILKRTATKIDDEDNHNNHELTTHQVPIKVITLVGKRSALVSDFVRVLVKLSVDGSQTDQRPLASLHHREPNDSDPDENKGKGRVNISGELGFLLENQSHDDDDGKDQETR